MQPEDGVAGLNLVGEELRHANGVELLLFCTNKSQLRWSWHLMKIPPECRPLEVFSVCQTGRSPHGTRAHWRYYISHLAWEFILTHRLSWKYGWTEGHLKILAQPAATMTQPQKSRRKWVNGLLPMTIITFLLVLVLIQFANMYSLNLSVHIQFPWVQTEMPLYHGRIIRTAHNSVRCGGLSISMKAAQPKKFDFLSWNYRDFPCEISAGPLPFEPANWRFSPLLPTMGIIMIQLWGSSRLSKRY